MDIRFYREIENTIEMLEVTETVCAKSIIEGASDLNRPISASIAIGG
jgi:hypothetical protein